MTYEKFVISPNCSIYVVILEVLNRLTNFSFDVARLNLLRMGNSNKMLTHPTDLLQAKSRENSIDKSWLKEI